MGKPLGPVPSTTRRKEKKHNTLLKKQRRINQLIKALNTVGSKNQLVMALASKPEVPSSIPGTYLVEKRIDT